MAKIIPLKPTESSDLLRRIADKCENDEVTDFVVMARLKNGQTVRRWFGAESSFRCLGMTYYLCHQISRYIDGNED